MPLLLLPLTLCSISAISSKEEDFQRRRTWDVEVTEFAERRRRLGRPLVYVGDLNVAPEVLLLLLETPAVIHSSIRPIMATSTVLLQHRDSTAIIGIPPRRFWAIECDYCDDDRGDDDDDGDDSDDHDDGDGDDDHES